MEDFAHERKSRLKKLIGLENSVPFHDTLRRVLGNLDLKLFQTRFIPIALWV
ncbi:MAG: transposase family protein [Epsilonproteobacteria bacterium]|nr:transposase family protein [Campylobacterota bacterium]